MLCNPTHSLFGFSYAQKYVMRDLKHVASRKPQKRSMRTRVVSVLDHYLRFVENEIIFNLIAENFDYRFGVIGKIIADFFV